MNGHVENKWARVPKAWEDLIIQGNTPNEENQITPDNEGSPLSYEEEMNKEEDAVSVNPRVSHKQMTLVSDGEQTLPLPHFVDALKNLLDLAPTVLQREEPAMEAEWAEARDESLRVLEEGLAALQRDVAKNLVGILDGLDRSQRLRRRARDAERRSEKERWRKGRADADTWAKRWAGKWEGWSCEKEDEEEISGMCLEVRHQMHTAMDKTESEREEEIAESDGAAAKQELAAMELLMDELGGVEETCRRHCQFVHDRTVHLWEAIEKNRLVKTVNSEISEQYPITVAQPAIADPCSVRGRRALLPPITSLNEKGCKHSTLLSEAGAPTQGNVWHMEPLAEINREKNNRKKKKVDAKVGEEEEEEDVGERNGETESVRKSLRQRLTEWLHAPLCGCSVRCY